MARVTRTRQNSKQTPPPKKSNGGLIVILIILIGIVLVLAFKDQIKLPNKPSVQSPRPSSLPSSTPNSNASPTGTKGDIIVDGIPTRVPEITPTPSQSSKPRESNSPSPSPEKSSSAYLFFVEVTDESIKLVKLNRNLALGDSPLSVSIRALIQGPSSQELGQGYMSLIPAGTKLLNAYIQGRTAFLSFSEEFQYNKMGSEGTKAQLKQIVYTATEYKNIDEVQFLIEGRKENFVGGDGFNISRPLTRKSF